MTASPVYAIGLDVGGTKIAGGVVALPSGDVLERGTIATRRERGGEAVLEDTIAFAEKLRSQAARQGHAPVGIGIGVPELVDPTGAITSAHNFDWRPIDVAARFEAVAPTVVDSDVRVAALAEALLGAGRDYRQFAYVSVGTGISHTLVVDGRPFTGARGNALVLTSGALSSICPKCGEIVELVIEEVASGPALAQRYNQQTQGGARRAEDVVRAAAEGDQAAMEVVRSGGEALGNAIGFLINVVDPEAIVIGGGLGQAHGLYWDSLVASTRRHVWADTSRDLPIVRAALQTEAGVIGAAATAWRAVS